MRNLWSKIVNWGPLGLIVALGAIFFGRRSGPDDNERRLHDAVQAETRRRINAERDRDAGEVQREVEAELAERLAAGDDGFMDDAFAWDRANPDNK